MKPKDSGVEHEHPGIIELQSFFLPSVVLLTESCRPLRLIHTVLCKERERPALNTEAYAACDGVTFAHFNIKRIPERVAMEINRGASDRLLHMWNVQTKLILHLLIALEGSFHLEIVREERIVRDLQ
ncbi:hypothetical protein D3C85_1525700 [compost metagenome]